MNTITDLFTDDAVATEPTDAVTTDAAPASDPVPTETEKTGPNGSADVPETPAVPSPATRRATARTLWDAAVATLPAGIDDVDVPSLVDAFAAIPRGSGELDTLAVASRDAVTRWADADDAPDDAPIVGKAKRQAITVLASHVATILSARGGSGEKSIDPVTQRADALAALTNTHGARIACEWVLAAMVERSAELGAAIETIDPLTEDELTSFLTASATDAVVTAFEKVLAAMNGKTPRKTNANGTTVRASGGERIDYDALLPIGWTGQKAMRNGSSFTIEKRSDGYHVTITAAATGATFTTGDVFGPFTSLSTAAKRVNGGTEVNGPDFWGAKKYVAPAAVTPDTPDTPGE